MACRPGRGQFAGAAAPTVSSCVHPELPRREGALVLRRGHGLGPAPTQAVRPWGWECGVTRQGSPAGRCCSAGCDLEAGRLTGVQRGSPWSRETEGLGPGTCHNRQRCRSRSRGPSRVLGGRTSDRTNSPSARAWETRTAAPPSGRRQRRGGGGRVWRAGSLAVGGAVCSLHAAASGPRPGRLGSELSRVCGGSRVLRRPLELGPADLSSMLRHPVSCPHPCHRRPVSSSSVWQVESPAPHGSAPGAELAGVAVKQRQMRLENAPE